MQLCVCVSQMQMKPVNSKAGKLERIPICRSPSAGDCLTCSLYLGAKLNVRGRKGGLNHYVAPEILIGSTGLPRENKLTATCPKDSCQK